jgi:hypothetical protein
MKNNLFFAITLLTLFSFSKQLSAQFYEAGQNPPSVKWKIIDNKRFSIIFPDEIQANAIKLANYLYNNIPDINSDYSINAKKFPIILHNRTVTANGFVTLAPKRSEWYALPPQDIYSQPWLEQMALHEYRHIVQISQFYRGFTKYMQIPFGQIAVGSAIATFIPSWVIEGDAVISETMYSNSGRGRLPEFSAPLKAQLLEKKIFSYNKAIFGSYKDFVPDIYTLGYYLTGYTKIKYGNEIFDKVFSYTARYPYIFIPFATSVKKYTGKTPLKLYKETIGEINNQFSKEINTDTSDYKLLNTSQSVVYTNYYSPKPFKNKTIAVKSSLNDITRIVSIDSNGFEKILFTPGYMTDMSISNTNDKILWAEYEPDIRWGLQSYSVIKVYDLNKKKIKKLTNKTRYFSPAYNKTGDKIACIENNLSGNTSLIIIDAFTGNAIRKINFESTDVIAYPSWNNDGDKIIAVITTNSGKSLIEYNLITDETRILIPFTFNDIKYPKYFKNYIIFSSSEKNTNEIFAFDTVNNKYFLITSSVFGSFQPQIDDHSSIMYYTIYTSNGYKIVYNTIKESDFKEVSFPKIISTSIIDSIGKFNKTDKDTVKNEVIDFEVKKYKPINHLFNFHSWAPLSIDAYNQTITSGVSVMSQNLLSTLFITAGYEYISQEKKGKYYFDLSYKGLFPIIDINAETKSREGNLFSNGLFVRKFTYRENTSKIGIRVPLRFAAGKYYTGLQPSLKTQLIQIVHNETTPEQMTKGMISSLDYRLYFYHLLRTSKRDIYPRWGQIVDINFRHSPFGEINFGNIGSVETWLYFPSFIINHGLMLYGGYQKKNYGENLYRYSDLINYPFGTSIVENDNLISISANYTFPVLYPDLSLGSLIYLKRIHSVLSSSLLKGNYKGNNINLSSYSVELNTEFHFLRFLAPFQLGYRFSYIPDKKSYFNEILFNINFSGLAPKN